MASVQDLGLQMQGRFLHSLFEMLAKRLKAK